MKVILILVCIVFRLFPVFGSSYEGCFKENPNDREFSVAGGDLSYDQAEPLLCTAICKSMTFKYAALQEGYVCVCGDSLGKHSNGSQSGCIYRCSGDQVSMCGGPGFGSVYSTATAVKDFTITDPDFLEVFQPSSVLISLGDGSDSAFYAFDYGDTTGVSSTMPEPQPHIYVEVGVYLVFAWVWNTDSGPLEARREVFVEAPISDLNTICDPFVEVDHLFTCVSGVGQGTSLQATWNFNDETDTASMNVADAHRFIIGEFLQRNITSVEPSSEIHGVYIMPFLEVEQEGTLEAWEVYAIKEGQVLLQVFRPLCAPGEKYCTFNRTCINRYWLCPPVEERMCRNETAFCIEEGSCQPFTEVHIQASEWPLNNSCTYSNQMFDNFTTLRGNTTENITYDFCHQQSQQIQYNYSYHFGDCIYTESVQGITIPYKLVGSNLVYLTEGYNIFTVQAVARISLKPHDVLGFTPYQQKFPDYYPKAAYPHIGEVAHTSNTLEHFFFLEKSLLPELADFHTDASQKSHGKFYVRAHMSKKTEVWIQHSFTASGMFRVDVEFTNRLKKVVEAPSQRVASQYRILSIEGLDFTRNLGIYYACTDVEYPMKVEITQGTFVRFQWFFPNGSSIVNAPYQTNGVVDKSNVKTQDSQSYHFDKIGNYTTLVKAYNNVSVQYVTLFTIARYRILGLNGSINLYPGDNTTKDWNLVLSGCWFNFSSLITSGNVVEYIWDYGDGQGSGDWQPDTTYSHYYEKPSTYTVSIRSDNIASVLDHTFVVTAEKPNYIHIPDYGTSDIPVPIFCKVTWHSGEGLEFQWDFGDGTNETVFNTGFIYHNFSTYSVYDVSCKIANYPLVTDTQSIIIQDPVEGVLLQNKTEILATTDSIGYTVTWTRGNDVQFAWYYGDQVSDDTTLQPDTSHVYSMPNYYFVNVNVSNVVSWMMSNQIKVELQERVTNTQVACEDNMVYHTVEVTTTTDSGNKIWYDYDFGDGNSVNFTNSSTATHIYVLPGIFHVSVTAYNNVSSVIGTTPVQIDTVIEATYVDASTPHVRAHELECKCTAVKGSSALITFDWGDGSTDGPFDGIFAGIDSYYTSKHTYETEGTFNITCYIENPWSNSANSTLVVVQEAIVELLFEPNVAVKGNIFNFTVLPFAGDSHDLLLEWNYDDGFRYTTTYHTHQYVYRDAGKYDVVLMATNLVSKLTISQELYIQEHVVGLMFLHDVMPVTPGNATVISWSIDYGTDVEYTIDLGDGVTEIIQQADVGNMYSMFYQYQVPGSYNVTVKAANMLNSLLISTLAHMEYPIEGLTAYIQGNSTVHTDQSAFIKIVIEQGTNVEYTCDYHDGSAPIKTTKHFCKHMFIELGPHLVTVAAANHLSADVVSANETYLVLLPPIPQMIQDLSIHSENATIFGNPTFFYLEKTAGNMFNCTWDFGDGSTYIIDRTMYYTAVIHTYEEVDEYDVLLNCSTYVYPPVQAYKHIHVQLPITGLMFNITPMTEYGMDFLVNFTIETGTDVVATILYEGFVFQAYVDNDSGNGFGVIPAAYVNQSGWVEIVITAENLVTQKLFLTKKIYVQNEVTGLKFWADKPYVAVGTIVTCYVSLDTGTNVTFEWHFGTNYVVETYLNETSSRLSDSRSHFYSQVGLYAMYVIAWNRFNAFTSTPVLIAVQNKIHGFSISTNDAKVEYPNGTVIIDIQWNTYFKTIPTNATLTVDFGDESESYATTLDDIPQIAILRQTSIDCSDATIPHFESQCQIDETLATESTKQTILSIKHSYIPGVYTVTGLVYNLASEQAITLTVQIQEPIVGCSINTFYLDGEDRIQGGGPANNYFSIEHAVVFSANHTQGTGLRFGWRFGDDVVLFTNDLFTPHEYPAARGYTVRLFSRNIFGSVECSTQIFMQKKVIGLYLAHSGPTSKHQPITVIVFVVQVGTSVTYILDVPGKINMTYYLETPVSNHDSIQEALNIMDNNIFLPFDPFTHSVSTFELTFNSSGNYRVDVVGFNFASSASAMTYLPITKEPCQLPRVIILGGSKNFSDPLTIKKSFNFILSSDIGIFCQETISATIRWSVHVLEFFNGEPLPLDASNNYNQLSKDVLLDQAQLVIPRGGLDYGCFVIQLTVTMNNEAQISNSNHTYLQVVPSQLVAHLSGGHYVTHIRNESLLLNASLSFDPDAVNSSRGNDAIAEGSGINLHPDPDLNITWSCRLQDGKSVLTQIMNEPEELNYDTQARRDVYKRQFSINVSKEGRKSTLFEQEVTLIDGYFPIMNIICIENCKYKVSPSHRLVIRAVCQNCGNNTGNIHYDWQMPLSGAFNGSITGPNSKYFVIPSTTLLKQAGETLLVYLSVNRDHSHMVGKADYEFIVGLLPEAGSCSIIPISGISYETSFSISCHGYSSQQYPLSYEFLYNHRPQNKFVPASLYTLIYHSPEGSTPLFNLPAGEGDDNIVQILVKVTDVVGAIVEEALQVEVTASTSEVVESKLLALTSNQSNTLLDELIAKGDTQASVKYIGDLAVMLNQVSKQEGDTWGKQLNQKLRSKLVDDVENVVLQTIETLQQMSSVLTQIMNEPEELNYDTQIKVSKKYSDMLSLLQTNLNDQLYEENVQAISTNFFAGASNLLKAASYQSTEYYDHLSTDPEAWNKYLADADIAADDDVMSKNNSAMLGVMQALLSDDVKAAADQKSMPVPELLDKSRNVTKKMLAFVDSVSNLILRHKVPGKEALLLQTDQLSLLLKREDLNSLGLRFYLSPDGSWFKIPKGMLTELHSQFGDEIMVQVMSMPDNPYTWHASGYEVRTSVASLTMRNLEGETLAVSDLNSRLEMLLPRGDASTLEFDTLSTAPDELLFVNFNISEMYSSIHIDIVPTDPRTQFTAYLRFGFRPTTRLYDLKIEMPLPSHSLYESIYNDTANITTNPFTWFIAENVLYSFGSYYLAVRPKPLPKDKFTVLSGHGNDSYADDPRQQVDFDIKIYNARCLFWSEKYEQWFPHGCEVGTLTMPSFTHCLCNHLTAFGGSFFVAGKKQIYHIEETVIIVTLEESQLMYYILGGILCIFLFLLLLAFRLDRQIDEKMFGDLQTGPYNYLLTIFTGNEIDAGTTSEIYAMLSDGSALSSGLYHLSNPDNLSFKQGSIDAYFMSTPKPLNNITSLTIYLDGHGYTPSWHLSHACIMDCWTGVRYFFFCNCWMSKNCHPQTFKATSNKELSGKLHLFDTDEIHHGFWSYWRTIGSSLTLTEITVSWLVSVMMIISCCIIFHNYLGWKIEVDIPFNFSASSVMYGLQAGLISLPVRLMFIYFFSSIKPRLATYTSDEEETKLEESRQKPQRQLSLEDVALEENVSFDVDSVRSSVFTSFPELEVSQHSLTAMRVNSETKIKKRDAQPAVKGSVSRRWSQMRHHGAKKHPSQKDSESSSSFTSTSTDASSESNMLKNLNQNANPQEAPELMYMFGGDNNQCLKEGQCSSFLQTANHPEKQMHAILCTLTRDVKMFKKTKDLQDKNCFIERERVEELICIRKSCNDNSDTDGMSADSETVKEELDSGVVTECEDHSRCTIKKEISDFARRFHQFTLENSGRIYTGPVNELGHREFAKTYNYNNNAKNTDKKKQVTISKTSKNSSRDGRSGSRKKKSGGKGTKGFQRKCKGKEMIQKNLWKQKQRMHAELEQKQMQTDKPSCVTILLEKICRSREKRYLPWWVTICLWILALCIVAGFGFFSIYFGLAYPEIVVMNMVVALISALIISLMKVPIQWALNAFFKSLFWKRFSMSNTRYIFEPLQKRKDLKAFLRFHRFKNKAAKSKIYGSMNYEQKPITKNMRTLWIIVKISGRGLFTALVLLLVFVFNDPPAYYMKKATEDMFVSNYETNSVSFYKVSKGEDFFQWSKQTFHPAASLVIDRSPFYDHLMFLGFPRFRQFRVQRTRSDSCRNMNMTMLIKELCAVPFSSTTEDQKEHFVSWSQDLTSGSQLPGYDYISPEESSGGIAYRGKYASYSNAGYIAELGPSSDRVLEIIDYLQQRKWIDQFTRAVFVEFAVINLYTSSICIVTLVMEISPGGYGESSANYAVLRYAPSDIDQYIVMALAILTLALLVSNLRSMNKQGRAFYQKLSNLGNLVFICLSLTATFMSYMYIGALKTISLREASVGELQELAQQQQQSNVLATALLMVTILMFLDSISWIPHLEYLTATLKAVLKKVLLAQPIYIMTMALFVFLGRILYGSVLQPFSSWVQGLQLLFRVLLGGLREGTPDDMTLPYFFIIYVIMTRLCILLVFVTIIIRMYSAKKLRLALEYFVESGVKSKAIRRIQTTFCIKETLDKVRFRKSLVARKWRLWRNQQSISKVVLKKSNKMILKIDSIIKEVVLDNKELFKRPADLVDEVLRQIGQRKGTTV
ncbi:uncharacterized protein LOC117102052 [Anneissia japonica]|uniref:uncharacterized protein LOC117102052 n=1 Tax=Anneissia japonica TaxID=1529436 RepID=UPI0014255727|nr:uncharacterized protein LOC117102052 [Anneissia japonica]